ncbi:MAG TPA: response regulator [Bryobacteraceae bacterium]|nr:response regulator [Bryobacteraceae bacterium]
METEDSQKIALVVADNRETVLRSVSATLEKAGFIVLATSSGSEAIKYARESAHPVELAVIDSEAKGINAPELAGQLDEISPLMRTLLLTSEAVPRRKAGILHKPFRRARLLGQVFEILDRPKVLTA